jgi:hypothetical protein
VTGETVSARVCGARGVQLQTMRRKFFASKLLERIDTRVPRAPECPWRTAGTRVQARVVRGLGRAFLYLSIYHGREVEYDTGAVYNTVSTCKNTGTVGTGAPR